MIKNKVVITGGSGFVGTNLIKLLINKTKYKQLDLVYNDRLVAIKK